MDPWANGQDWALLYALNRQSRYSSIREEYRLYSLRIPDYLRMHPFTKIMKKPRFMRPPDISLHYSHKLKVAVPLPAASSW